MFRKARRGRGRGLTHDRALGIDLAQRQHLRDAVLRLHERLEKVLQLLLAPGLVPPHAVAHLVQHDAVEAVADGDPPPVLARHRPRQPVQHAVPPVRPHQVRLRRQLALHRVDVADHRDRPVDRLARHDVVAAVEAAQPLAQPDVDDGVHGEVVGPLAVVDRQLLLVGAAARLKRRRATRIEGMHHPLHFTCNLVLPVLEVLDGVGAGEDFALARVLALVDDVGEVEVRAGLQHVHVVFQAFGAVAVDVLAW